jgi:starch synthase
VFTIHNLAYQGLFEPDWLPRLDLPWDLMSIDRMEYWGRISFLKGGINDADIITTVSPRYAQEIQTPQEGSGMDGVLRRRAAHLFGILNGIDTTVWDPKRDHLLPAPFSVKSRAGKRKAKRVLLEQYGLPADAAAMRRPIIGMISRLVDQKGLDLMAALERELPSLDASWVALGTGEARYEELWRRLARAHPDRIGARIGFDEPLAHLIEGGADIFLMPSRFEPCGLNQMYSLRYGTVPVVRAVGGLADTVRETDEGPDRPATGFVFVEYSPSALLDALSRALTAFHDRPRWGALQAAGMREDHSWDRSAREYVTIYGQAMEMASARRLRGIRL